MRLKEFQSDGCSMVEITRGAKHMIKNIVHLLLFLIVMVLVGAPRAGAAENIDPANDGSQYAYGENVGWFNAEPGGDGGPGVEVSDVKLTGWLWAENVGWVSLSCENTSSCGTVAYEVTNNGAGNLSGFGWGENIGWVSFSCANTSSCATVDYGLTIEPTTGDFSGRAWGENIGWVTFSDTSPVAYKVQTEWYPTATLVSFFDAAVDQGTLVGDGPGRSATGRLVALRNMIIEAGNLVEAGYIAEACQQLQDAYNRCDGEAPPRDFVSGDAAADLEGEIQELIASLECE
jgi:hypothetical protein